VERERASFALPPSAIRLNPTDVVSLDVGGRLRDFRLRRFVDAGARSCEALASEQSVYATSRGTSRPVAPPAVPTYGPVLLEVLDLPVLDPAQFEHAPWFAGRASPWAGIVVLDGSRRIALLDAPASLGETVTSFGAGPTLVWDNATVITLRLYSGTLESRPDDEVLAGGVNAIGVRNADGEWEIVQFATATLVAPSTFELRRLLRGRLGTEHAMRLSVAAGARVSVLDRALRQGDVPLAWRGAPRDWRYGPASVPSSDPAWRTSTTTFKAVALRPWSPVHLRGSRDGEGNLFVSWVRRARRGGEWLDGADVPLAEESERYDAEVLNGTGTVLRSFAGLSVPALTYSAGLQAADFGSAQPAIRIHVYQLSGVVGRGVPAEAVL